MMVNGKKQLQIPIADRAVQYGDGCFTTIAFKNGHLEFYAAHVERLKLACEKLFINFDNWTELSHCITDALSGVSDCVVKVIITRGEGGRGYSPQGVSSPNFIVSLHALPEHYCQWQQDGIKMTHSPIRLARQPLLAGIKHLNRLEQVLIKQRLLSTGFDDAVVCDTEHNIVETSVGNVFWYKNNTWFTPEHSQSGVEGVMRNQVLAIFDENSVKYQIIQCQFCELVDAEEIFVCNSLMAIVPVASLFNSTTNETTKYSFVKTQELQILIQRFTMAQANKG